MTRDDLTALIARVEAAKGPDRALDWATRSFVAPGMAPVSPERAAEFARDHGYPDALPHYTASLDAAASLVPEGWFVMLGYQNGGQSAGASLTESPAWQNRGRDAQGTAATPALALTAAALRARLAQMGDDA